MSFVDYIKALCPPWLANPAGVSFTSTFGQVADSVAGDAAFGVRETMLEECTQDAYPNHLRNSNLQVIANEAPPATLDYLRHRWIQWRESGGKQGMMGALYRLGWKNVEIWSELDLQVVGVPNPFGGYVGFFFVLIKQPPVVGPGYHYLTDGKHWKTDDILWGLSGITRAQLEDLIATIQKFKPATSSCRFIVFDLDGTAQMLNPIWGDVQWGGFQWGARLVGNYTTIPVHEHWELEPNGAYRQLYNYSYLVP